MTMSASKRSIFPWESCDVLADLPSFATRTAKPRSSQLPGNPQHQFVVLDQQDRLAVAARRLGSGFDRQGAAISSSALGR
jgi:hypothetical protein